MKTRTYMYKTAVYGSPIKAAILKTEKGLNVVLRPRCSFDLQATFLLICVCVCVYVFLSCAVALHTYFTQTHTHTCKNIPVLGTDPHFSLRQFACLASERTCLTSHAYMMTNPTFNLLCLFAARTNFFYLINDHALKAAKCRMNRRAH